MTVRNGLFVALALLLAAAAASPAAAFTLGGWEGGPDNDETGAFSDCTMTASYESGITLGVIISRNFDWGLVLANDKWRLPIGSAEDVTLKIDEQAPIPALAKVVDEHGMLIPLETSGPAIEAMRHGRLLIVMTPSGELTFRLGGVSDAITQLAACVSDSLEAEQTKEGNSALSALESKAQEGGGTHRLFTPSQAADFATTLLAAAGVTDYTLVDPAANPMPNFDVVWSYGNGIIGALAAYKDMGSVDLDEEATVVMADDAKGCKGDFTSGKKDNEIIDGVTVRRLFTACRGPGQSIEIHYTLLKTPSGHLIQIAHMTLGDATGDVATADAAFLRDKAMQNFK
jgi:hypothetical protein